MLHNQTERCYLLVLALLTLFACRVPLWAQNASKPASSLATAKAQLDHGELTDAESALWTVLGTDPKNEQALTLLGVVRGRQQRYAEAEALFRRVLQLNPKSTVASKHLADTLLAQNKPDDAIGQYHHPIQLRPQDSKLKIEAAKLELARGNFAGALAILNAMGNRLPDPAVPLKAASLLGVGRKSDAEALIAQVRASPMAAVDLAQVFVEAKDADAALKTISLINPVPKSIRAQTEYVRGRALAQTGNYAAAVTSFQQALTIDPKSVETMLALAEILASQNKHRDSLMMLQKAREVKPDSREILRHFIVEAMQSGQNDRASEAAQDLQRRSTDLDDRFLIASVMVQQKQFLAASHILEDYVAQRSDDAKAYLGLGIAYLNLLRYAEARQALERSLQIDSGLAETQFQLGLLASQQGNRQDAMLRWQKAVELQPRHPQALFNLGNVYLESGDLAQAERAFSRSLTTDPGNMKAEYNLALVLNKLGKTEEAKEHFDHYKKMQEQEHTVNGNARRPSDH
jgi:tetratricopeptide (TPR) repeat protein